MGRPRKNFEKDAIVVAKETGFLTLDDGEVVGFKRGVTRFRASHPAVKRAPHFFEPISVHYDVEQMTAAPGEQRGV
jgi:hypothetical protein